MDARSGYPAFHLFNMTNWRCAPADIGRHVWKHEFCAKKFVVIFGVLSVMVLEADQVVMANVASRLNVTFAIVYNLGTFVLAAATSSA
jgi:hypothetical protein